MTIPTIDNSTFELFTPDQTLRLRPLRLSDAPNLRDRCADPLNVKYLPHLQGKENQTVSDVEQWISTVTPQWNKDSLFLVVEDTATGNVIAEGPLGYVNWQEKWAESGIMLSHEYSGKGVATKALKTSMDYAFHVLGLEKVKYGTMKDNKAMVKVLSEKLGKVEIEEKTRKDGLQELNFVFSKEDWGK